MQITLNQTEIETALRRYVNDQVNVREGHEIVIDLKAGRGENGHSAIIDIVPQGQAKASEPTPAKTGPITVPKVRGTTQPVGGGQPVPDTPKAEEATPPETAQEAAGEAPPETATSGGAEPETASDSAGSGEAQASDGSGEAAAPPEGGEKPKSLFANLGKPKN